MARREGPRRPRASARSAPSSARSRRCSATRADDRRRLDRHQQRHRAAHRRGRARRQRRRRARRPRRRSRRGRVAADRRERRPDRRHPPAGGAGAAACAHRRRRARMSSRSANATPARVSSPRRCGRRNRRICGPSAKVDAAAALAGVALIEAENEAEEALAAALALRETLETPGRTAALVTPDPAIARRVAAELAALGHRGRKLRRRDARRDARTACFARLAIAAARDFTPAARRGADGLAARAARPRRRSLRRRRAGARSRRAARAAAAERPR